MVEEIIRRLRRSDVFLRLENGRLVSDAPRGAMTPEFVNLVRENKEAIVEYLKQESFAAEIGTPPQASDFVIPKVSRNVEIPLSFSQQSLWFLEQLSPGNSAYNIPLRIRIARDVDTTTLQRCLDEILCRHEILRTRFRIVNGSPTQVIGETKHVPLSIVDLSKQQLAERTLELDRMCIEEAEKPFQIDQDLLIRATLFRLAAQEWVLALTIHHIVVDGPSVDLVCSELAELYIAFYEGLPSPLPTLRIQYADFAVWQRGHVQSGAIDRQLAYWTRQMAGAPPTLNLPIDGVGRRGHLSRGSTITVAIPKALSTRLKALGQQEHASLFMVLLAGFQTLLYRYSGDSDIVVGTPISSRNNSELEGVVGLFVNTLPIRNDLSGNPPFRQVLTRMRDVLLDAHKNQDIPFEMLVKELRPPRILGANPLFQAFFSFRSRIGEGAIAEISNEVISGGGAKFDLSLNIEEFSDGLRTQMEYATELFRREIAADFLKRFLLLLESIATAPEARIDVLPISDAVDLPSIQAEYNRTKVEYPLNRSVDEIILEQANINPNNEAVSFGDKTLTYRQFTDRVQDVAHKLRELQVKPNDVVAICVERSIELVVGVVAILNCGAAFAPLDPHHPRDRLAYTLNDVQAAAIMVHKRTEGTLPSSLPKIDLDDQDLRSVAQSKETSTSARRQLSDLAYVLYTSGSTGFPKGVEITHQSLLNFLFAMQRQFSCTSDETMLAITTISFDIAILELLLPLFCGGRVVIASRERSADPTALVALLEMQKISMMQATPATWRMLLAARWSGSPKLKALCGGEAWSEELAEPLLQRCASLWNMYGPTETTIWSAVKRIEADDRVLIGPPIANTQLYVLGPTGELQPTGIAGELYIGGAGLARGYRGRPELTAEKFVSNPFSRDVGDRLYKTGDRVRRLSNGEIQFLGRLDSQVKIRGYRIELEEVAAALRAHMGVSDAVVVVQGDDPSDKRLVAFCTRRQNRSQLNEDDLRSHVKTLLPSYMIPTSIEFLETLPLTSSGKIDRKALEHKLPATTHSIQKTNIAPRTYIESVIAKTWASFLKVKDVAIDDNVFDLGAHSLMVVQVLHELNTSLDLRIGVPEVFENPTVAKLAAIGEKQRLGGLRRPRVVTLRQGGKGTPIYFIYAGPAELALADEIGKDRPVFGIEAPWPLDWRRAVMQNESAQFPTLEEIVEIFETALSTRLGSGHCVLAGYSFAGLLAFEVARRFMSKGGNVDTVIVIDKWLHPLSPFGVAWKNLKDCWGDARNDGAAFSYLKGFMRSVLVLWWTMGVLGKHFASSMWLRPNIMTSFLDEDGIPLRWKFVEKLYIEIEKKYEPQPLDCRGVVIRPEFIDRHGAVKPPDGYLGWKKLFERGCELLEASGDHFSMVREHNLALAQLVGRAIRPRDVEARPLD